MKQFWPSVLKLAKEYRDIKLEAPKVDKEDSKIVELRSKL